MELPISDSSLSQFAGWQAGQSTKLIINVGREQAIPETETETNATQLQQITELTDSVEISGLNISQFKLAEGRIQFSNDGTYVSSSSLNFQLKSITSLSTLRLTSNQQLSQSEREQIDWSNISQNIARNLRSTFGDSSGIEEKFMELSDRLQQTDPELYEMMLVFMKTVGGDNAESLAPIINSFEKITSALSSNNNAQAQEAVAEISITVSEFEATISKTDANKLSAVLEDISFSAAVSTGAIQLEVRMGDPLVLDIGGNGIDLRSADEGVMFDITGTGKKVQTAFISGDDALLYLDQNGNGIADNGNELFGDQEGDENGFAELAQYDENHDGVIDEKDGIYSDLRLFQDLNGDGINQESESSTLEELGVASINLGYEEHEEEDGKGNVISQFGNFTRNNGETGSIVDAWFRYYT